MAERDGELDEATRPAYPVPAGATYTAVQLLQPEHLREVHDHLRGELSRLRDLVEQVREGLLGVGDARSAISTMTLRQNSWTLGAYCQSWCRVVTTHHTLEDQGVFPHLRTADPAAGPVLDRLAEEHVVVHGVLEELDRALVALVGAEPGATGAVDDLAAAVDRVGGVLLSHLAYEERELHHPLAVHGLSGW